MTRSHPRRGAAGRRVAPGCSLLLLLLLGPVLAGCSPGGSYAPGPSVVPSPPPGTAVPLTRPADLDLSGDVETGDGLSFHVVHEIWFGDVATTLPDGATRRVGWTRVQRAATGRTTVSNPGSRPNPTAGATLYVFYAGYPAGSTVCRLSARQDRGERVGRRCWLRLGTSVPYSYGRPDDPDRPVRPEPLGAGETRSGGFDALPPDVVDTPVAQFTEVAEALRHPADVVVLATGIGEMAHPAYRHACRADAGPASSEVAAPGAAPTAAGAPDAVVIVGGSSPLGCHDVPSAG